MYFFDVGLLYLIKTNIFYLLMRKFFHEKSSIIKSTADFDEFYDKRYTAQSVVLVFGNALS